MKPRKFVTPFRAGANNRIFGLFFFPQTLKGEKKPKKITPFIKADIQIIKQ